MDSQIVGDTFAHSVFDKGIFSELIRLLQLNRGTVAQVKWDKASSQPYGKVSLFFQRNMLIALAAVQGANACPKTGQTGGCRASTGQELEALAGDMSAIVALWTKGVG